MNNFPSLHIPKKKKDEAWHKEYCLAIANRSINDSWSNQTLFLDKCYSYFDGSQSGDEYQYLQEAHDGDALPAQWMNLNKIRSKINVLLGELEEREYEIQIAPISKEAESRKEQMRKFIQAEMKMKRIAQDLEQEYGLPLKEYGYLPQDEEELEEFFDTKYKDELSIIFERICKFLNERNDFPSTRQHAFRDILLTNTCILKSEIVNGVPKGRRIDPRNFIIDPDIEDDYFRDAAYFGEVRWMNLSDCAEQYNLDQKELESASTNYFNFKAGGKGASAHWGAIKSKNIGFFNKVNNQTRALILDAVWCDSEMKTFKTFTDKEGVENTKQVNDTYKAKGGEKLEKRRVKVWRKATLIGGSFLKDYGLIENQPVNLETLSETLPPYLVWSPNFINSKRVSLVSQLFSLQDLKDILVYSMQLEIATAGGKGFVYDVSQRPEGWSHETVIKYIRTSKIAFIDSKRHGTPAQFNQFQPFDHSMSQNINQYLSLMQWIDVEMDAISGINEARQGVGRSDAVGVTQAQLMQSNRITEPYFKGFQRYCSGFWKHQVHLSRFALQNKERFEPVLGRDGLEFLNTVDFEVEDVAVTVKEIPKAFNQLNEFKEIVVAAIQTGQIHFADGLELLQYTSAKEGIVAMKRIKRKSEKQQSQQAEAEQGHQMKLQEMNSQANNESQERAKEKVMLEQELKGRNALETQMAKIEGDLAKLKIEKTT